MRMLTTLAGVLVVGAIAVVSAGAQQHDDTITGAGSTFVSPLVSLWTADYGQKTGVKIAYSPVGSVGYRRHHGPPGRFRRLRRAALPGPVQRLQGLPADPVGGLVDRDHLQPLGRPEQPPLDRARAGQHLPGQRQEVGRSGDQGPNPKANLPSTAITPVYRSDNSGTTYNFTDYLSVVSPAWKSKIGVGVNANWPAGQGGKGSSGAPASSRTPTGRSAMRTSHSR